MKKKGLIVATIVMVLVLAVSLTTATYAWFSQAAEAAIETIDVTVGSSPELLVGVKTTATDSVPSSYAEFRTGAMTYDDEHSHWNGSEALGVARIDFTTNLKLTNDDWKIGKAVSYTNSAIMDGETQKAPAGWYKAEGTGTTDADRVLTSIERAVNGRDYVDAVFLVAIGKAEAINQTFLKIVVKADDPTNLGMAAALHFYIATGSFSTNSSSLTAKTYTYTPTGGGSVTTANNYATNPGTTLSAYEGMSYTTGFSSADCKVGTYDSATGTWTLYVPIHEYDATAYAVGTSTAKQVRLIMWIEGSDDACVTANAGTGFSIDISFNQATTATKVTIDANGKGTEPAGA